jgi:hypothetical protein
MSVTSFSTGDFLFDVPLSAEMRGLLPDVDGGGGGMMLLSRKPE